MRISAIFLCLACFATPVAAAEILFQSPSGNIQCQMSDETDALARCDLSVTRQTYTERPASCDGDWGTSFVVRQSGPGDLNCAVATLDGDGAVVLPYGASLGFAGIQCRSEPSGVTCINRQGGGFVVRRSEQRVF